MFASSSPSNSPVFLFERDETRRSGRRNIDVRPVLAVGRAGVNDVVDDETRAVRGVVREHAEFVHHVVAPDDVGVLRADFRLAACPGPTTDTCASSLKGRRCRWPCLHVEAHHFATAGHDVDAIAFDGRRGKQAEIFPIVHFAGRELRHDQAAREIRRSFRRSTIRMLRSPLMLRIAR